MIKLIILDVDGVLTSGKKFYDSSGRAVGKEFNDKDFTAIKKFKAQDIKVCFLSGDENVNSQLAIKRKIDFFFSRQNSKLSKAEFIDVFIQHYNVAISEMLYVGDDDFDLDIIDRLVYTYCPSDASAFIKKNVYKVLNCKGGEGVVDALYYALRDENLINYIETRDLLINMRRIDEQETL